MALQILQISNGYLIFDCIDELQNAIFFPTKKDLIKNLDEALPTIDPKRPIYNEE